MSDQPLPQEQPETPKSPSQTPDPEQKGDDGQKRVRSKTLTRTRSILQNDMDLINRYARKYSIKNGDANNAYDKYRKQSSAMGLYAAIMSPSNLSEDENSNNNNSNNNNNNNNNNELNNNGLINNDSNISKKNRRTPSNLINNGNLNAWNASNVSQQQSEMMNAMNEMLDQQTSTIIRDKKLLDEIELASSNPNNKDFGKLERADDWDCLEVCWWLSTIHLDKYITIFHSQIIDGSILLRDLDENMLTKELGIKRLHVRKLMREIQKLRELSPKFKEEQKKK